MNRFLAWAVAIAVVLAWSTGWAGAQGTKRMLTIEVAEKMALACEAYAKKQQGWRPLNIAILDDAGDLLYFRRDPSSFRGSIQIAIDKAWTSTQFPLSTRFIGEQIVNKDPSKVHGFQFIDRIRIFPGGLPIMIGNQLVGAIGVSGATGDQDEECAQAGLDAVKDMLK
jgi:uncharacterized protein GlcG (DUF336 family)